MREFLIFLVVCAIFVLLIGGTYYCFCLEQDWQGAKAWTDTRTHLKAQGEPVEAKDLIPAPIPDAQNLGALEIFQYTPDPLAKGVFMDALTPGPLNLALKNLTPSEPPQLPVANRWALGEAADPAALRKILDVLYLREIQPAPAAPLASPLAELDALCPALDQIREATATRPLCRFNLDYASIPPFKRPLSLTTKMLVLAKAYNLHAVLALHENRPDVARGDIEIVLEIDEGLRREPILVSGLVANAALAVQFGSLWEGLHLHAWNDAQLAGFQSDLKGIDLLADEQLCLHGESILFFAPNSDWIRDNRSSAAPLILGIRNPDSADGRSAPLFARWIVGLAPNGWFDLGKSTELRTLYEAAKSVDPVARRVFPEKAAQIQDEITQLPNYPWNLLPRIALGPMTRSTLVFAYGQFRVDAARIACMHERYRLAQGVYPPSLDALRVYDPDGPPRDLFNGEPLRYRLNADGTYLLYSVGWNQTDEGGKVAHKPGSKASDNENGDWVWPGP